jgi:hypothetical protein
MRGAEEIWRSHERYWGDVVTLYVGIDAVNAYGKETFQLIKSYG